MPRYIAAQLMHEANTFSPRPTTLDDFRSRGLARGEAAVRAQMGDARDELPGFIAAADAEGFEVVPVFAAFAWSSGPILRTVYDELLSGMLDEIRAALPADGILLALHGAMVLEHAPDGEGDILEAVRKLVGPDVPIVATLDTHANVTGRMVQNADALVGWWTYPHVDRFESAERAAKLIGDITRGMVRPAMAACKLPLIVQAEGQQTTHGPNHELVGAARALTARPDIAHASVFAVQPWLDIPEMGGAVVVVAANGSGELAAAEAEKLGRRFWELRSEFEVELVPVEEAVDRALAAPGRPVVLGDSSDASGAPRDGTAILKSLLRRQVEDLCLLAVVDSEAVGQAFAAGEGAEVSLEVGGKRDTVYNSPATIRGTVLRLIPDGRFRFKGKFSTGAVCRMGRATVLAAGGVRLLVTEAIVNMVDPELYRSVGLEPTEAKIVVVKSPNMFRVNYSDLAHEIIMVDAPGFSSGKLRSLPFRHVQRPIYPLDEEWDGFPGQILRRSVGQ